MSAPHAEHPDAAAELTAAAERLEEIQPGLGHALFAEIRDAIDAIEQYPEGWPPFPGWDREPLVRSKGVKRFHYRVVYFVNGDQPVILAYAHERQRPGYWMQRFHEAHDR